MKLRWLCPLLLLSGALAQTTHTFTFGPLNYNYNEAPMTTLDGQPANCGVGYCGTVEVRGGFEPYWGLIAPQQNADGTYGGWRFPNNGFLTNNTTVPDQGPLTFDSPACQAAWTGQPSAATLGCTSHTYTEVAFQGYGQGVTITVTANYQVNAHQCRYRCDNDSDDATYTNDSTGGSGTAVYQAPQ